MIIAVFRSRLNDIDESTRKAYAQAAARLGDLVKQVPGFISHKTYSAPDGERVTIAEFESMEAVDAWARNAEHVQAKKAGRATYYKEYTVQTCEVVRTARFPA